MPRRIAYLLLLSSPAVLAQMAQITGQVVDNSGALIQSANVTAVNIGTSQRRTALTNEYGYYTVPLLPPGVYELHVLKPGFEAVRRADLTLSVNEIARLDFTLSIAGIREAITVKAQPPLLDYETPTLGGVIVSRQVLELPLLGRNPYALGMLVPGVRTAIGMNNLVTDVSSTSAVSINGGRNNMNAFLLDGAPNSSPLLNQPVIFASVDSVQEFKVDTNCYSAEFGRAAGGIFNVVTKSGTNDLHFTAYEFLRNRFFNANDPFANSVGQRQPFRLSQFGGVIGGPVQLGSLYRGRNRTFFFLSTELVRFAQGVTFTGTVPNANQLSGDFSQLVNAQKQPVVIYDPLTTHPNADGTGYLRSSFPGNRIPPERIDPVARNMSKYWPAPNIRGTDINNFVHADATQIDRNTYGVRLDHMFTEATRAFMRYSYDDTTRIPAPAYGTGYLASPVGGPQQFLRYNAVAEVDRTLAPNFVTLIRASFARLSNMRNPLSYGFDIAQLGFPASLRNALHAPASFPAVLINGYGITGSVPNAATPLALGGSDIVANLSNDYTLTGSATRVFARHSLKFGVEARRLELNIASNNGNLAFSFSSRFTEGPIAGQLGSTSGNALASFLLGVTSPTQGFNAGGASTTPFLAIADGYWSVYIEDAWKVTNNLTLTLGLRYDYESPRKERFNQLTNFDFRATPPLDVPNVHGALSFVGVNGVPRYQSDPDRNNFAPRAGIAWTPFRNTVVRAAGGIFYAPTTGISGTTSLFGISGFQAQTIMTTSLDTVTPSVFLHDPFPQGLNRPTGSSLGSATLLGQDVAFYDRANRVPYTGQWNIDVQRQLPGSALFDVAYVGSRGLKLPADRLLNQLSDSVLALGNALSTRVNNPFFGRIQVGSLAESTVLLSQLLRPYPQFGQVTSTAAGWSSSSYHALQAKVEKRYSALTAIASYTYSKMMDDSTGVLVGGEIFANGTVQNWNNLRSDWSTSVLDQTHRLVISGIYTFPSASRRNALVSRVLEGWEIATVVSVFTGAPIAIASATENSNSLGGRQRPNWTGLSPALRHPTPDMWFDISQFSQPAPSTFGTTPRTLNGLRTDGARNMDFGLNKTTALKQRLSLQFRAEAFNVFNRPQYAPPNTMQGARAFGVVTALQNMPRILQFGLKLIY